MIDAIPTCAPSMALSKNAASSTNCKSGDCGGSLPSSNDSTSATSYMGWGSQSEFLSSSADIRRLVMPLHFDQVSFVGRKEEIATLTAAMERIRGEGASAEIVCVHGASGNGKSKLVQTFEQIESKRKEFWVTSKFGQYDMGSRPLGAIVDATTELWSSIQESQRDHQNSIRDRIQKSLNHSEIQLLARVVPSLEGLLSEDSLGLTECDCDTANEHTFTRVSSLYRKLLTCVCSPQNPAVMFLDDVQWADDVSKQLIASIARDATIKNFLLVLAFRDNFSLPDRKCLNVTEVKIGGLSPDQVNILTSAVVGVRCEETVDLGRVVYNKTQGNCFFVRQYLEMLHREDLLFFDWSNGRFRWNLQDVRARTDVSDNIATVVASKIGSIRPSVRLLLILASCLGYKFTRKVLQTVLDLVDVESMFGDDMLVDHDHTYITALLENDKPCDRGRKAADVPYPSKRRRGSRILLEDVEDSLAMVTADSDQRAARRFTVVSSNHMRTCLVEAVAAGLLEEVSEDRYKFSHDRIQQSAFSMLPRGKEGEKFQQKLGETILQLSRSSASEGWMLFTAADLLTKYENSMDKSELAELCLNAALSASSRAAFLAASRYASAGVKVIGTERGWREDYSLALQVHNLAAEMQYANGEIKTCRATVREILKCSNGCEDSFRACNVLMDTFGAEQDWKGGTYEGLRILDKLGIKTPKRANAVHILFQLNKAKRLLNGRQAKDIETMPRMNNPVMEQASRIIASTSQAAWHIGDSNLTSYLCLELFMVTLKHGTCVYSPYACTMYGGTMSHTGDFEEAYQYGETAMRMLHRKDMSPFAAKTTMIAHGFLLYLKRPIQDSLEPLIRGYEAGMQNGKILDAAFNLQVRVNIAIFAGMRLQDFDTETKGFIDFHHEYKQMGVLYKILPWYQLAENLLGNARDPLKLIGSGMNEDTMIHEFGGDPIHTVLIVAIHQARMVLLYLLGAHDAAEEDRIKHKSLSAVEMSTYVLKFYAYFFKGMNCLALARMGRRVRYYRRQAIRSQKELEKYANSGSVNAVPLLSLISAELCALGRSPFRETIAEYNKAISISTRCGFRMFTGIACECRGVYLMENGMREEGIESMQQAFNEFCWYGAKAKTDQLAQKYKVVMRFNRGAEEEDSKSSTRFQPFLLKEWQKGEAERRSSDLILRKGPSRNGKSIPLVS